MKILKVYAAFLAESPLCYGYWKMYTDHEAHLGSIDKVLEVYEHAVQGVTYSVDVWLRYCIFAINTYEDRDTIQSFRKLVRSITDLAENELALARATCMFVKRQPEVHLFAA